MAGSDKFLKKIEASFAISLPEMRKIMRSFRFEMKRGLAGLPSSLEMIPTFVDRPRGDEKGKFIALDLGGTNFRILELELKGSGRISDPKVMKFSLKKDDITGSSTRFFDFIAKSLKNFIIKEDVNIRGRTNLGFTFSFPVKQSGVASGVLLVWTKGFNVKGVIGKDVVRLLDEALKRNGLENITISALANDTVGTLAAKSYEDRNCDVGIILGTGTNACYTEKIRNIVKPLNAAEKKGQMIINTEWGNFKDLTPTIYDKELDRRSTNRGKQILEKMVSGMYLGEVARLVLNDVTGNKISCLPTEYMSVIEADCSSDLSHINRLMKKGCACSTTIEDRRLIKKICRIISLRGARLSAACLAAIITKMDPKVTRPHTVAIDGSVYEKHPHFARNVKNALKEIFGKKASRIKIALAKDGSGKGAAIIAAAAAQH